MPIAREQVKKQPFIICLCVMLFGRVVSPARLKKCYFRFYATVKGLFLGCLTNLLTSCGGGRVRIEFVVRLTFYNTIWSHDQTHIIKSSLPLNGMYSGCNSYIKG
jgi:hypothetical protein